MNMRKKNKAAMNQRNSHKHRMPAPEGTFRAHSNPDETDKERLYRIAFEEGLKQGYRRGYEEGLNNGYHEGYEDRIRDQQHNERSVSKHHPGDMKWHRRHSESWKWI